MSWTVLSGLRNVAEVFIVINGLLVGLSLIVAIGAQNAFALRQGLLGAHIGVVVAICAASDALLIAAGVAGLGAVVQSAPGVLDIIKWVGAAFLICYAGLALRRAYRGGSGLIAGQTGEEGPPVESGSTASAVSVASKASEASEASAVTTVSVPARTTPRSGLVAVLVTCLALTWLNPHVYLDTVLLLGSVAQRSDNRWLFAIGAMAGSILWFSALGFGARLLRPVFARPVAWRVLDGLIAATMLAIAVRLLLG